MADDIEELSDEISTHAPRTGSDTGRRSKHHVERRFQPTLPARGATELWRLAKEGALFQPTLPARGATKLLEGQDTPLMISTHAPRTGSDRIDDALLLEIIISTHAPRTGSDCHALSIATA